MGDTRIHRILRAAAAAAALVLPAGVALAQSGNGVQSGTPMPRQDQPPGPGMSSQAPPERVAPALRSPDRAHTPATGVIRPPSGVDPAVQAPVPHPRSSVMPVIPPAGTPGGNPSVQPR